MMTGLISIDFRWGDRRESSMTCAARTEAFLKDIASLSSALSSFGSSEIPRRSQHQQRLTVASLQSLFEAGVSRRDLDKSVVEDLGFLISLSNSDLSVVIRLHCGIYCGVVPNTITIEILKLTDETRRILNVGNLKELFRAAVRAWEPERGLVTSMKLWETVPQSKKAPNFGWVTYLSRKYVIPQDIRARFRVEEINGAGNLIMAIDENSQFEDFEDTSRVQELVSLANQR